MANLREAFDYAAKNPNSQTAKDLEAMATSGALDIEAQKFGIDLTPFKPQPVEQPKNNVLQKVTNTVNDIFPGKKVGEAIGTLAGAGIAKAKGNYDQYDLSAPTPLQVAGDVAQGALTVAAPSIGGKTPLARIGANAAVGAGLGGTNAISEGKNIKEVAKDTALGGAIGGGLSTAGELVAGAVQKVPKWLTKYALPKLKDGNIEYALENTKVGTLKSVYNKSNQAVSNYGDEIKTILSSPKYSQEVGNVGSVVSNTLQDLPDAQLDQKKLVSIVKSVAPQAKTLVDKVADGTATVQEQNSLRQVIDKATKKIFTDNPSVSFNKEVAAKLANQLRNNVQSTATETAPVFAKFSQELDLNNAILQAAKKRRVLGDLIAGGAGFASGGLKGAAIAIAAERTVRSPSALLAGAKAIRATGKALPVAKALKAPIIKKVTK